jgi:hypothetical protein
MGGNRPKRNVFGGLLGMIREIPASPDSNGIHHTSVSTGGVK